MPRLCAPLAAPSPAPGRAGPPRARVCLLQPSCSRATPQRVSPPTRTRRFTYPKLGTTRPCGCPAGVERAGARPTGVGGSPAGAWSQTNRRRDHQWWLGGSRHHHRARLHGLVQGEEMAEAMVVVLLTVGHAHLTHRSFSVSHQRLSFHPHAYTRAGQRAIASPPRRKRTAPLCACHPSIA